MTRAYYNEIDPFAAAWLRELITQGHLPAGDVDERDIRDILPSDLNGYTQCHFFAGIGGWAYALRLAGWPEDRPVWTGSCPCQPFSAAGKGAGFADERHLWPAWFWLIVQCRPDTIFGEQVDKATAWLDLVSADLESEDYTVGSVILPAASVGAPHGRHRLWFVADSLHAERWSININREDGCVGSNDRRTEAYGESGTCGKVCDLGDTSSSRLQERERVGRVQRETLDSSPRQTPDGSGDVSLWSDCDWLPCRDGKYRPVEPGTFPLAHGVSGRVGRLRGYGNAIVPQVAAEIIKAYCDTRRLTLN